jgi:hypothetical protein
MEHAEARELLDLAAVEPAGFERLAAGDTVESAALAAHLAGCPDCTAEMARLHRASAVIREVVRQAPPADLRDRTLAFVAAVGRDRTALAAAPATTPATTTTAPASSRVAVAGARRFAGGGRLGLLAASIAAAIVVGVIGANLLATRSADQDRQSREIAALSKVATWALRIDGEPDARHVDLAATAGTSAARGTLVFSPHTHELVVVAQGLPEPAAGMQYRCWIEVEGSRRRIGQMYFGGDVSYWVGGVELLSSAGPGSRFGVSLAPIDGDSVGGEPVLVGAL